MEDVATVSTHPVHRFLQPGRFLCPDVDNDGSAEDSNCENYVGRLPYKTLETEDLREGSGERLWYVLSPNFRRCDTYPTSQTESQPSLTGALKNSGTA